MSEYSRYYTSSDVTVYIEGPRNIVMLDTLHTVGWKDNTTAGPIYGVGNSYFGFSNVGNVLVNGVLEINFTHDEYLKTILDYVNGNNPKYGNVDLRKDFNNMSTQQLLEYKAEKLRENKSNNVSTGILTYPQFNIRVVFNNGSLYHGDQNKEFYIRGCKIVSSTMHTGASSPGQVVQTFSFISNHTK